MAPAFDAELLTVSVELKIHIAQLMADAIRRMRVSRHRNYWPT
jgi:hypothetical protein